MYEYYIRLDADSIGDKIEYCLLCEDWNSAQVIHNKIQDSIIAIREYVNQTDYQLLMSGSDDLLIGCNIKDLEIIIDFIEELRNKFNEISGETLSAGIGVSVVTAMINLRKAKSSGRNKIIY